MGVCEISSPKVPQEKNRAKAEAKCKENEAAPTVKRKKEKAAR